MPRPLAALPLTLAIFVAAVSLAGCSDHSDAARSPVVIDGPVGMSELLQVCGDGASLTEAPAYTGVGPHPAFLFEPGRGNDPERSASEGDPDLTPHLFQGPPPDLKPALSATMREVQLVACVQRTGTAATDVVCQFDLGGDTPFLRATYRLELREARTGRTVSTLDLGAGVGGCPTSARVDLLGAQVYSAPTEFQYSEALRPALLWDGQGEPTPSPAPGVSVPRGEPVVEGSVTLVPPAGLDATSTSVLDAYRRYWLGFSTALADGGENLRRDLGDLTSPEFLAILTRTVLSSSGEARTETGPVILTPVVRPNSDGTFVVEDCVDRTGRVISVNGRPTGEIGLLHPDAVTVAAQAGTYVVTGFADRNPGTCVRPPGA